MSSGVSESRFEQVKNRIGASSPFRKMLVGVAVFTVICVAAVAGYMAAGWELADSIYMVIITIFGVGYGEVQPIESNALRALTIVVIVSGYAAVIYTVGGFIQLLIDGELNKALGARRMTRGIERLQGHTIVCGMGRLGSILAKELHAAGKPFVAIDSTIDRLQGLEDDQGYLVIHGDATEEEVLDKAGIRRASMLATVLSQDSANVFVTITAREMNPNLVIIARGENPRTEKKLLGCGANRVVLPTAIGAQKVAQLIIRPAAEELLSQISERADMVPELKELGLEFNEVVIDASSPLVDSRISDVELKNQQGLLAVGLRRADGSCVLHPDAETVLQAGDALVFLGHVNDLPQLVKRLASGGPALTYRGVRVGNR
ncbi:MAG: NAD-binding protein [bacterium]|nr:NAD-binding protein [bacterium]